jgi:hypothetical protein
MDPGLPHHQCNLLGARRRLGRANLQQAGAALLDGQLQGAGAARHVPFGKALSEKLGTRRKDGSSSLQVQGRVRREDACRRRADSGGAARRSELAAREVCHKVNRRAGPSVCAAQWQPARAARCHARWMAASPGCCGGGGELWEELCARAPDDDAPAAARCIRLSIHVRLRRSDRALPPKLAVFNLTTNITERGPYVIAAQSGAADVSEEMGRIVKKEQGALKGVSANRSIILHISSRGVPRSHRDARPRDSAVGYRALRHREPNRGGGKSAHAGQAGQQALDLTIVKATSAPNTSNAMKILNEGKLYG